MSAEKNLAPDKRKRLHLEVFERQVRAPRSRAKYDEFYDGTPVLDKAVSGDPDSMPVELLQNNCIVIFRIVLNSRSADLASLQPDLFSTQNCFYVRFLYKVGNWRNHSVTGRALLCFSEYLKRVCSHPCFFAFRQTKTVRAPLGPEDIVKVALKAMAEAGIDTAEWKAHFLRGAAATHFIAKGVPGAVVQARGGWASAATMADHYARQHQLLPWAELASSTPDVASGSGENASFSSSFLPRVSLQSFTSNSVGAEKNGILAGW